MHRSSSQAFSSSKFLNRSRGVKNRSRTRPTWFSTCPFSRAGNRVNQVMAAHLQEAAIVAPVPADEDRLDRGLHVVVDAAPAGAFEQGERPIMGVEHHLLRLTRIGSHEQHATMAE